MGVLAWVMVVGEAAAPTSVREAEEEQQDSRNMGNIGSHHMGGICNNMGMVPHNNKDQGYIPHIPPLKEARLLE